VFFLLRSAFWIVAVSFLLNGGYLPSAAQHHVPASARESAAKVVSAVGSMRGLCARHQGACEVAGDTFDFAAGQATAAAHSLSKAIDKHHTD
jgi:hypothetical protein